MPADYYTQTTPYSDFQDSKYKKYSVDDKSITFDDKDDVTNHNDVNISDDDDGVSSRYNDFDDDFGVPGNFIEAFNPNVLVIFLF